MGKPCLDRISVWKGTLARVSLSFRKMGGETMSNLTKSALKASLKKLLFKKPLDKITISDIAAQDSSFGKPDKFCTDPEDSNWVSATVNTLDEKILPYIKNICKRDPLSGKVVTGGIVTVPRLCRRVL